MKLFRKLGVAAALCLASVAAFAAYTQPLGGSAFPLTMVTQPVTNLTDAYNEMLALIANQTVGISPTYSNAMAEPSGGVDTSTTAFSTSMQGNPLLQVHYDNATVAQINSVRTMLASAAGRTIYPGNFMVMASGSAAGGTNISLVCSASGTIIATFPVANLTTGTVVTAFTSGVTAGSALTKGCSSADAVLISPVGTITTTTNLFINFPYTVQ